VQRDALPAATADLDAAQRQALAALSATLPGHDAWTGEALQAAIFDAARAGELPAGRMFAAIYLSFLGQSNGPRAGWLLAGLEPAFVAERLRAAATADTLHA
jgi:lysyl-tRNA synthetase class I